MKLFISTAPHIRCKDNTAAIMRDVIIALFPTAAAGIYLFGLNAALIVVISTLSAVMAEWIWQKLAKQPVRISDLSAAVTGLILGLNLPPSAPWWMAVIGSFIAVILVKQLFGGIGGNFMNPAMLARAVLLASWPVRMTAYTLPTYWSGADAVSSSTVLGGYGAGIQDMFLGNIPGSIGEVCKAAILIGFAYLLIKKVVSWRIPVIFMAVAALCCWAFGSSGKGAFTGDPLSALLSGGVMFGAVFMATDYTTSPMTAPGQVVFAAGCGLMVAVIRRFGAYPEGVTYAILLMNIFTPLIDKYMKPKVYGRVKANA